MSDDNIIPFSLARRPSGLTRKPWSGRSCRHDSVEICADTRVVSCATCDAALDPVTVLLQFADKERRFGFNKKFVADLDKRCEELRSEEKQLRARIRSAKKSDIDGAVAATKNRLEEQRQRTNANANEAIELMRKIIRANGGTTSEQRDWVREGRRRKAGPTVIHRCDE